MTPAALASFRPEGLAAVVPNGLDPDEWREPGRAPGWFAALPGPRLVYVGTLDDRLEVDAVRAAAAAVPQGSVTLIGRCPVPEHLASLRDLGNVTIASPVGRSEIAAVVAGADLGLIPHVDNAVTRSMSPLKLYEYLAAGLPVASVDLPAIRSVCPERTALASGSGDFAAAVEHALALGRWRDDNRLQFIDDNSWERRCDDVLDIATAD